MMSTLLADKIKSVLKSLQLDQPTIGLTPGSLDRLIVEVTSTSFDEMPEEERQRLVWSALIRSLSSPEQDRIEYVLTNSPSDRVAVPNDE